jgi:SAM-dependent methyltransferase
MGTLERDDVILNVGCGVVRRLEDRAGAVRYLATDIRHLPNVDFVSDATSLPIAEDSLDAVFALELIEHVPSPVGVLSEINRVLRPGGTVFVSAPSLVPRHDRSDFWRFTAQGLAELCANIFDDGDVQVFGGTFEALGYIGEYYLACVLHALGISDRPHEVFTPFGYWLDRHNKWSTSETALHTLAFDLLYVGKARKKDQI